jgi:hypothetical protein
VTTPRFAVRFLIALAFAMLTYAFWARVLELTLSVITPFFIS